MQFLMLILMMLAIVGAIVLFEFRKRRKVFAAIAVAEMLLIAGITVYFIPARIPTMPADAVTMSIDFSDQIYYPDQMQREEILEIVSGLRVRRRFFNAYPQIGNVALGGIPADAYVFITYFDTEGESVGLELIMNDPKHCYRQNGDRILNPEELLDYIGNMHR